jgi:ribonuclease P/MRP protein subunit POP7
VPKIVYVSTNTPFMSVAKRVQKLLRQAEKRATTATAAAVGGRQKRITEKERMARLAQTQERLEREKVYIKATGRAIEKALSVGRWFEEKAEEYAVQVKTGSVMVVDDIVEDEEAKEKEKEKEKEEEQEQQPDDGEGTTMMDVEDDASDGHHHTEEETVISSTNPPSTASPPPPPPPPVDIKPALSKNKRRRMRKKGQKQLGPDEELPEARTRWVNTVEIAVNLK